MPTSPLRKGRKVCFQHVRTGRIISASSVSEFARKARLGRYGRYQFDDVLKGKRLTLHGWGLPQRLNQRIEAKDVFGNQVSGTVAELSRRLTTRAINLLLAGKPVGGIVPASYDYSRVLPPRAYIPTRYTYRKGRRSVAAETLRDAATATGISLVSAFLLAHGHRVAVKGVTFAGAQMQRRSAFAPGSIGIRR